MHPRVLLIGPGSLGSVALELLAREPELGEIVVSGRDEQRGRARCNLARLGAIAQGLYPTIRFIKLDLDEKDAVAEAVAREDPALILHTATRLSWWLPGLLPPEPRTALARAGFGAWLPVNLDLSLKLMRALQAAAYTGFTIIAPYPDVVNPVLARVGMAPTCGVGNLDEIVPKIRILAAKRLGVAPQDVHVTLVAHHALERFVFCAQAPREPEDRPPYHLRISYRGREVGPELGPEELLFAPMPLTAGPATHFLTAGSVVRLVRTLLRGPAALVHVPGPLGLPGGYPVIASPGGVRLAEIPGLNREEAIAINERSLPFDGIQSIEPDGTVTFCAPAAQVLRDTLGYDCERLQPEQVEARAQELVARFWAFARRFGLDPAQARPEGWS